MDGETASPRWLQAIGQPAELGLGERREAPSILWKAAPGEARPYGVSTPQKPRSRLELDREPIPSSPRGCGALPGCLMLPVQTSWIPFPFGVFWISGRILFYLDRNSPLFVPHLA